MDTNHEEDYVDLSCDIDSNNVDDPNNDSVETKEANRDDVDEGLKKLTDLTPDDIWGLRFGSESEAYEFYIAYAKCHGFVVRKDDIGRDFKGRINMRQLVCNREGSRNKKHYTRLDRVREPKPVTRTNCPARFRVHFDYKTSKWIVVAFEHSHNHELTCPGHVHLIPSYRSMNNADKAQVDSLHLYDVRTCHIMGSMLGQNGGHTDLGFCKKDLYNHIDRKKRTKIQDDDEFAALCYLQAKADGDPMLFSKFTTTTNDRLQNLFWADGCSRVDYECFGDVLAFDMTYKKNKYNKPLVIFCGYNHHGETTIFGCALVDDEKTETYKWVLETFSEAMSNKHPKVVVTDDDNAIKEAIKSVFPKATHRLCSWHIQQNAVENVKNPKFLEEFKRLVYGNLSPNDFDLQWNALIAKFGLGNNSWAKKMYNMKDLWANAYMRDKLFSGIRTMSICEGINSFINRYVQYRNSLVDFMHNFERAIKEYRHNEEMSDFNSSYGDPELTTSLHAIELWASEIFTRKKFKEVKNEIVDVGALNVIERLDIGNCLKFKMNRFGNRSNEYFVVFDKGENTFVCDCRLFESRGIPCSHIFCAMKHEHMDVIPKSLICRRWTKNAKVDYIIPAEQRDLDTLVLLRTGALSSACNRLCNLAARDMNDFLEIRTEIHKLTMKLENRINGLSQHSTSENVIGDPTIVKTKSAPRKEKYGMKRRRCSHCKSDGHYIRKCPLLVEAQADGLCNIDEEDSPSESDSNLETFDNVNCSQEQNGIQQSSSVQVLDRNENSVDVKIGCARKRKQNVTCTTQNSVKECISNKQQLADKVRSDMSVEATQPNGIGVPHNLSIGYGHNLPLFPQRPIVPIYPNGVPPVPFNHPHNQSLPLYPQYFGFMPQDHGTRRK